MIKIAETGNTTIKVTGKDTKCGWLFTVYPYLVSDPKLQKFSLEKRNRIQGLSIVGVGDIDVDLADGDKMLENLAKAIAKLIWNINNNEDNKDLGLVVNEIDTFSLDGRIAKVLQEEYAIKILK